MQESHMGYKINNCPQLKTVKYMNKNRRVERKKLQTEDGDLYTL